MASKPPSQCASCSEPAFSKCSGCKWVVYCSKDCQVLHWAKHKSACKFVQLDKTLKRIANVIHEAYLNLRENTWDTPIKRIEEREDALLIYDGEQALKQQHFIEFPHELVSCAQAKMAVLCTLTCNEPLAWMHNMIQEMVNGLPVTMEEVEVSLRAIPRKVTAVHPNGFRQDNWPNYSHFLLRVTHHKSKFQWVLDIAEGQFGICPPLWDWKQYTVRFVDSLKPINVFRFGTNKDVLHELGKLDGNPSLIYGMGETVSEVMDGAIATFEKNHNLALSALLKLPENDHAVQKAALLDAVAMALCDYKKNQSDDIMAKWQGSRIHEMKFPGESGQKCVEAMPKLFELCRQATK